MIPEPTDTNLGPFSAPGAELIPWARTADALRRIQKYFVSTVRTDGRPHVTPLLATVALDALCFATGDQEQKGRNLRANPHCILTAGAAGLTGTDYVVEGLARPVTDPADREAGADTFERSFGWHLTDPDGSWSFMGEAIRDGSAVLYRLAPVKAFAYFNGAAFGETRYTWASPPE